MLTPILWSGTLELPVFYNISKLSMSEWLIKYILCNVISLNKLHIIKDILHKGVYMCYMESHYLWFHIDITFRSSYKIIKICQDWAVCSDRGHIPEKYPLCFVQACSGHSTKFYTAHRHTLGFFHSKSIFTFQTINSMKILSIVWHEWQLRAYKYLLMVKHKGSSHWKEP